MGGDIAPLAPPPGYDTGPMEAEPIPENQIINEQDLLD